MLGASTTLCDVRRPGQGRSRRKRAQFAGAAIFTVPVPVSVTFRRQSAHSRTVCLDRSKESAPSRWRLRPTIRLTSAEATATRRVINLGHSVLGATRTLGGSSTAVKAFLDGHVANCELFFSHRVKLRARVTCSSASEEEKRPGTKARPQEDSPSRERFRPPSRRTFRFRVVLLGGLRPTGAPCSAQGHCMQIRTWRSRPRPKESRAICECRSASGRPARGRRVRACEVALRSDRAVAV